MLFSIYLAPVKVWHISRPGEAGGGHVASGHLAECLRGYLGRGGEQRPGAGAGILAGVVQGRVVDTDNLPPPGEGSCT